MDYTNLSNNNTGKLSKVGIIGATRGYGYTLLAQIPRVKLMELRVICSRHPEECFDVLKEIGYPEGSIIFCENKEHINQASQNAIYSLVNGDQPRNLLDLYSWAMLLGLEVVAAGKSSEYDFVWDRESGELTYTDGSGTTEDMPKLLEHWRYQGVETLNERQKLLEKYTGVISADLCEMNLVSNITGLVPATPFLSYPIAKISELADIFIPEEDGGILKQTGVVDVFYNLRGTDEASFCGGEFIIIRCENEKMWEILKSKGHVMSRNDKYACVYYPYHYMGLETPVSILLGDFMNIGTHPECRQISVMIGVAEKDLPQGTELKVQGHHHSIDGLVPQLVERKTAENLAPFYLLNGMTLLKDVKAGKPITLEDVDLVSLETYKLYVEGLKPGIC